MRVRSSSSESAIFDHWTAPPSEIMVCDFANGLRLVSRVDLVPVNATGWLPEPPKPRTSNATLSQSILGPRRTRSIPCQPPPMPTEFPDPFYPSAPEGWKGTLRPAGLAVFEAVQMGNAHNKSPGVPAVALDYTSAVSLFNPKYQSLVVARRGLPRYRMRVGEIAKADVQLFRQELNEVLSRSSAAKHSVDWASLIRSVKERYLKHLSTLVGFLQGTTNPALGTKKQFLHTRWTIMTMLAPYHSRNPVSSPLNATAFAPVIERCSTSHTAGINVARLTPQEILLKNAVETVLHEICRVLGLMWLEAFDGEALPNSRKQGLMEKWSTDVDRLQRWLGWADWVACEPVCGPTVRAPLESPGKPMIIFRSTGAVLPSTVAFRCEQRQK